MDRFRYPIGTFIAIEGLSDEQRKHIIQSIAELPDKLRDAVKGLDAKQLGKNQALSGQCRYPYKDEVYQKLYQQFLFCSVSILSAPRCVSQQKYSRCF